MKAILMRIMPGTHSQGVFTTRVSGVGRETTGLKRILAVGSVAAMLVIGGGFSSEANATTVHPCNVQSVTTANDPVDSAFACEGIFSQTGQPSTAQMIAALNAAVLKTDPLLSLVGDWTEIGKIEQENPTHPGFSISGLSGNSGTWSITDPQANTLYGIVMKGANQWGAWLPTVPTYNGFWSTDPDIKTNSGKIAGLSNFTLFSAPMAPIPLPAAGWLMLAGLGGLAAMRRRKKTS